MKDSPQFLLCLVSQEKVIQIRHVSVLNSGQFDFSPFVTRHADTERASYAVTSYAAQGKTADYVIFSDSAIKAATNQKQWYVTISRGRKGVEIFTRDKRELRENVIRSGNRGLALEIAAPAEFENQSQRTHKATRPRHTRF